MQLYLRPFYSILRQQNNFEWATEHQTRFKESKNRTIIKYNPRSKSTIVRNFRCFKLWHRRSIATITTTVEQTK